MPALAGPATADCCEEDMDKGEEEEEEEEEEGKVPANLNLSNRRGSSMLLFLKRVSYRRFGFVRVLHDMPPSLGD